MVLTVYNQIYSRNVHIGILFCYYFVCVSIYAWVGHWDLFIHSRFLSAKISGVSSYGKLIPELASSHMVSITFFPADLAGSEADLRSRTPQPGPGRALGSKEMRENGDETAGEEGRRE